MGNQGSAANVVNGEDVMSKCHIPRSIPQQLQHEGKAPNNVRGFLNRVGLDIATCVLQGEVEGLDNVVAWNHSQIMAGSAAQK